MANTMRSGRIAGSPLDGLCERVCICVPRVWDGCREDIAGQTYLLALTGIPPQATPPFTFTEAVGYGTPTFEQTGMTPAGDGRYRITGNLTVPVLVTFTDSAGTAYTATSTVRMHREITLRLPARSVTPYSVEVFVAFYGNIGSFVSDTAVSVNACMVTIFKVIVPTDLLVPSYGTCVYPVCGDTGDAVCNAFLSLPLFPE